MILRVIEVTNSEFYNDYKQKENTKYYQPLTATKEKIKEDFGLMLDTEIQKLQIDYLI